MVHYIMFTAIFQYTTPVCADFNCVYNTGYSFSLYKLALRDMIVKLCRNLLINSSLTGLVRIAGERFLKTSKQVVGIQLDQPFNDVSVLVKVFPQVHYYRVHVPSGRNHCCPIKWLAADGAIRVTGKLKENELESRNYPHENSMSFHSNISNVFCVYVFFGRVEQLLV